ncbi:MAG: response regulator [Candidatus Hydrogenedentes bacterium]|nr:response regulator [Candidatus Hydrogenedentota bacterium]
MNDSVLIVDDSLTVRMDLADAFLAAGFNAVPCATAEEARRAVRDNAAALVVLDVLLPDADGLELLRELRASPLSSQAPILMLSTEAEVQDRVRAMKIGADEYVGKPYDRNYLVSRARELLRTRRGRSESSRPTVLVIDDSPTFREALREALQTEGYEVVTATTGEEGLHIAADIRPNAIIVDGVLPGEEGATIIRRIRLDAALRHLPCLLLTASEEKDSELNALAAGADAFVRKEGEHSLILARLAAILRSTAAPSSLPDTTSLLAAKRILAVDDSLTYLHGLAEMLRTEGYDVVLAHSGEEALELLAVQPVDCILLDLLMPGLSGHDTCRRIKAAPAIRDIPLIMLTALEEREAMLEGLSVGADDYIAKSSDFRVLQARVQAQIRRRQFEDENRRIRERLLRAELEAAEARATHEIAKTRAALIDELERKNEELEAFSYSVSHDLRAPLRAINGFSNVLLDEYAPRLDQTGQGYLQRIISAAKRMGNLIDDLLQLSRVGRMALRREPVDVSCIARAIANDLLATNPERRVEFRIQDGMLANADSHLLRIAVENLLGNAWKFTSKADHALIEIGVVWQDGQHVFSVKDNGAGFNNEHAKKLFAPFQRLHAETEFRGTGIGLATVYRIIDRHGGRIWGNGEVGKGATFYWTLPGPASGDGNRAPL